MTSSAFSPPLGELSTNWLRVFTEVCEMLHATTQVVNVRTTRMAMAGPLPNERDSAEFTLMSREKSEAASESILAMGSGLINLGLALAADISKHVWATSAAAAALASSRSAGSEPSVSCTARSGMPCDRAARASRWFTKATS